MRSKRSLSLRLARWSPCIGSRRGGLPASVRGSGRSIRAGPLHSPERLAIHAPGLTGLPRGVANTDFAAKPKLGAGSRGVVFAMPLQIWIGLGALRCRKGAPRRGAVCMVMSIYDADATGVDEGGPQLPLLSRSGPKPVRVASVRLMKKYQPSGLVQAVEIDAGVVGQDPVLSGRFQRGDESAASQPPSGVTERFGQAPAVVKAEPADAGGWGHDGDSCRPSSDETIKPPVAR